MVKTEVEITEIIKRAVEALSKEIIVERAFLFGSYAAGAANENSDVDLAVFSSSVEGWSLDRKIRLAARVKDVSPYLEVHIYPMSKLEDARPTNFYGHILKTGKKVA